MALDSSATCILHRANIAVSTSLLKDRALCAWTRVTQRHPRMRALLESRGDACEVQSSIDIQSTLTVREGPFTDADMELKSNAPRDRSSTLFHLYISVISESRAHVVVCADHVVSDGMSGCIILADFLRFVAEGTNETEQSLLPLPSIMTQLLAWTIPRQVSKFVLSPVIGWVAAQQMKGFQPRLRPRPNTPRLDTVPLTRTHSNMLFWSGNEAGLQSALKASRANSCTLHGPLLTMISIAFAVSAGISSNNSDTLKLAIDVDVNLRERVPAPHPRTENVGPFIGLGALEYLRSKGISLKETFWSACRAGAQATSALAKSKFELSLSMHFCDRMRTDEVIRNAFHPIPGRSNTDANFSNLGLYPFPLSQQLQGEGVDEKIEINELHFVNNCPTIGPAVIIFAIATSHLTLSVSHTIEADTGVKFMEALSLGVESIGGIGAEETIEQVITRLWPVALWPDVWKT